MESSARYGAIGASKMRIQALTNTSSFFRHGLSALSELQCVNSPELDIQAHHIAVDEFQHVFFHRGLWTIYYFPHATKTGGGTWCQLTSRQICSCPKDDPVRGEGDMHCYSSVPSRVVVSFKR